MATITQDEDVRYIDTTIKKKKIKEKTQMIKIRVSQKTLRNMLLIGNEANIPFLDLAVEAIEERYEK